MWHYLPQLLQGLYVSLMLAAAALVIGFLLSLLCTCLLVLQVPIAQPAIKIYLTLFTGTPLLVQIFLIYYGPGQFEWLKQSLLWPLLSAPWFCALLALALNSAAYSTQLFHAALRALVNSYGPSCTALGMSRCQTLAILGPLALKRSMSAYTNEVTLIFKSTSLASTITLMDLMGQAQQLNNQTYDTLTLFGLTGLLYLLINGLLVSCLHRLERYLLAFDHR